jgi:hypothetical protein
MQCKFTFEPSKPPLIHKANIKNGNRGATEIFSKNFKAVEKTLGENPLSVSLLPVQR